MLLMHVFRNFITRLSVAWELFFDGVSKDAARKVFYRLVDDGFLKEFELYGRESYYRLGAEAVRRWGYPRGRTNALGPQRLPYELGTLSFMSAERRKRLLPHELKKRFPWFPDTRMNWAYFTEGDSLGTVRVETRTCAERVVEKLNRQVYEASGEQGFRQLIDDRRFQIAVITASEMQDLALQGALDAFEFPVHVDVYHDEELMRFI